MTPVPIYQTEAPFLVLQNATPRVFTIVDIRINEHSVYPELKASYRRTGRLEDQDDLVTILPGEALVVNQQDGRELLTVLWQEA